MVAQSYIKQNLKELDNLYNKTTSLKKNNYYSKLALLELCGWIELSFDEIILSYGKKKLKDTKNIKYLDVIVKKNSAFSYSSNIRPLLMNLIGIIQLEKIEKKLDQTGQLSILNSKLEDLKKLRNSAAHTYSKGTTATFTAPSMIINDFHNVIVPIIINLRKEINRL